MNQNVLIVDDDVAMCEMLRAGLGPAYDVVTASDVASGLQRLRQSEFVCMITDVRMGAGNGIELCRSALRLNPHLPVIVITAFGSIKTAVEAIRAGAFEFVTKPFELETLRHVVARAVEHLSLTQRVQSLEQSLQQLESPQGMIGTSEPIRQLQQLIQKAGPSDATVLVQGESGSGKELVARMVHAASGRSGPFLAINCAALPEALLESELFGHAKGAFTDAKADKVGLFLLAKDGTLFLDEIAELPLRLQPKLLRVLQERSARPVGGRAELPFNARVVAATNRNLESEVHGGRFREDLYYRVQVVQLDVPPLRVRGNDVLLLAQSFVERTCQRLGRPRPGLSRAVTDCLLAYAWPGNVRELQNCIERALTLGDGESVLLDDLPERIRNHVPQANQMRDPSEFVSLEEVERRYILQVFDAVSQNKSLAARILGLNRKTLYRKLRDYGVVLEEPRPD
jgi:DNA-binding NtrC family response regulator